MIFTIGHSRHPFAAFVELLRRHAVTLLCDVRSSPYSQANIDFNREVLERELRREAFFYRFLGDKLGGRPEQAACYEQGRVRYDRVAKTTTFQTGIAEVEALSATT